MITAERPSVGTERTIVVAPPRRWSPSPELLDRLVQASLAAPWMSGVRLDDLLSAAPPELDRAALRYPRSVRARELSRPYVTALRDVTAGITNFASVLTEPDQLVPELDRSVYRLESTWWRGRQQRADRLFRVRTELGELRAQIKVLPGSYTFGSRSGIIPVTVANGLDQTVSVQVLLAPRVPKIRTGPVDAVPVGPGRKVQVPVPAQAVASGLVFVQAGLLTPTGQPYSEPVELKIRITQYGTVALYVTMAAAAVLLLAGGVRTARRAMGQRDRAAVQP
jgi:hypothetical protein